MASSVRVSGSLPDPGDSSTKGLAFAGGWGAEYDWGLDRVTASGQPRRLSTLGFSPFDSDLEGALRGRAAFSAFLYLFKDGRYLRLQAATMRPDGPDAATAPAWGLPAHWTSFDAVVPGRGIKINFCYFFRGREYVRFDWTQDAVSPGYPKFIGREWHLAAPFDDAIDGVIVGQAGFTTKAYLFKALAQSVSNADGGVVAAGTPGSTPVQTPGYARYDFTAEASEGTATGPLNVVPPWNGLFPVLDAGPAVDTALQWCDAALFALASPATPALTTALGNHFMTGTPSAAQLAEIAGRMAAVRNRIAQIPDKFQWTPGLTVAAQTTPGILTEIGDTFSILHGPSGRAAVLIHEAVHFVFVAGGLVIDVPEFSGATIGGHTHGIVGGMAYSAMTPAQAIANPSSYAAFAQEIFFGSDTRFGDARRHE
jgi:hemopexin